MMYGNQNYNMPMSYPVTQSIPNQNVFQNQPMVSSNQNQQNFFAKIVDSIEAVKIADVPMDGNSYLFPKADGSEIYAKKWLPNFTTDVSVYVKVVPEINNPEDKKIEKEYLTKEEFEEVSNNLLDKITNMFDEKISKFEKAIPNNKSKGVNNNV